MPKHATAVLIDESGDEMGKVTDVIPNPRDLEPEYIVVRTGRLSNEHLVPIAAVEHKNDEYIAPFDVDVLKSTPPVSEHTAPAASEREAIYEHFGLVAPATP
jgi:hypothetical protein